MRTRMRRTTCLTGLDRWWMRRIGLICTMLRSSYNCRWLLMLLLLRLLLQIGGGFDSKHHALIVRL